jgi:hypothetical protein
MSISIYDSLVPVAIQKLETLSGILKKGAAYAQEKKVDESVLLNSRLYPDMFPFARQVQIACDTCKAGASRLAEIEIPSHPDVEKTFNELQERIQKTISFLKTIKPQQLENKEKIKISYKTPRGTEYNFVGLQYLSYHVLPNIYFHITTAYDILRHNGVELGKKDYLGNF